MNRRLISSILGLSLIASFLIALACSGGQNVDKGGATPEMELADMDTACDPTNIDTKLERVRAAMASKIKGKLKDQLDKGYWSYAINKSASNDSLEMTISGNIGDVHNNANTINYNNFADLIGIVKKFVRKKCTSKVIFMPTNKAAGAGTLVDGGFMWFACEDPNIPCGTECLPSCPNPGGNSNGVVNGNVNTNANTNVNSNSNTGNKNGS